VDAHDAKLRAALAEAYWSIDPVVRRLLTRIWSGARLEREVWPTDPWSVPGPILWATCEREPVPSMDTIRTIVEDGLARIEFRPGGRDAPIVQRLVPTGFGEALADAAADEVTEASRVVVPPAPNTMSASLPIEEPPGRPLIEILCSVAGPRALVRAESRAEVEWFEVRDPTGAVLAYVRPRENADRVAALLTNVRADS
jgi:hypothetical protein